MNNDNTLNAGISGIRIITPDETPSTNNYATTLLAANEAGEGCVVWTFRQTRGRGYGKNVWESEPGMNLTFSLVLEPSFLPAARQFLLSQVVSLGVAGFLREHTGDISVKWPNDIYAVNRKIGGILIENTVMGDHLQWTVAGIGLNVNQSSFPAHLPHAVSLKMLTGREVDLRESLHSLLEHILTWYQMLRTRQYRQIRESYLNGMYGRGRSLTYRSGERRFTAEVEGVDDYGQLLLKDRAGVITTWPFKGVELLL